MSKTAQRRVTVTDANSDTHTFEPGDEVPDELVARINNPDVWEPIEYSTGEVGNVDSAPAMPSGVRDAPYATPPEGDGVVTPAGGPTAETMGYPDESSEGDGLSPTSDQLDRMNRSELDRVAKNRGLVPEEYATKAELRSAIDSAPAPADQA